MSQQAGAPRSGTTIAAAIVHFFLSGLMLLVAGLLLLVAVAFSNHSSSGNRTASGVFAVVVFVVVAFAIGLIFVGVQFLRGRVWARWTLVVFYGLGLLSSIVSLRSGSGLSLGLLIDIAMLVLLLVPSTARDFGPRLAVPGVAVPGVGWMPGQPPAGSVPPGWYRDPSGADRNRYWDGNAWTAHIADADQLPSS